LLRKIEVGGAKLIAFEGRTIVGGGKKGVYGRGQQKWALTEVAE